jgi:histidine ammonia-lyase
MNKKEIIFGDNFITIDDVVNIAKSKCKTVLSGQPEYVQSINKGAEFLNKVLEEDGVIYGVTTGYGDSCLKEIDKSLHKKLPLHLVRFHGCGLGDFFDEETTRAILAVRLCSLARGFSGVRYDLLKSLELLIQNDILPIIPQEGSVGASGDLTPLSYVARALIGEEKVRYQNEEYSSADLFKKLKLTPLVLEPKEGLALMNGTSVMSAIAAIAFKRAQYLGKLCSRITAMTSLCLRGNAFHFDELLFLVKPHQGQMQVAKWIREDLANEETFSKQSSRLQDRYSTRCAPHIIGVLTDTLPLFKTFIETEINSANDNPIICADAEKIMHGGHFYGGHIAFAMDSLKNIVANLADMMDRQMALLVDEKFNNGLPSNLSGDFSEQKNVNHGFKAVQIGVSAWTAEALKATMPASVFSRSTECHNQDKVSMGTIAARDCMRVLQLTEQVAAALLLACTQGITIRELKGELKMSDEVRKMHQEMQEEFEFLVDDRPLDGTLRAFINNIQQEKWGLYE